MKKNLDDYFEDSQGHQTPVKTYEQLLKEKADIEKQLKHHAEKEMADRVEKLLQSGVYHWKDDKGRLIVPAQHWDLDMLHHQRLPNDEQPPQILTSKDYHDKIKKYYGGRSNSPKSEVFDPYRRKEKTGLDLIKDVYPPPPDHYKNDPPGLAYGFEEEDLS